MIVYVHKAHATLLPRWQHPSLGRLLSPRQFSRARDSCEMLPVAADNDCFQGLDVGRYRAMLQAISGVGVDWIVVPDVVADPHETRRLFVQWRDEVAEAGPVAFVLQDGEKSPPWDEFDCLFVGGSTAWKMSNDVARIVVQAKAFGKLVHFGRVNTRRRFLYVQSVGADSVDGTNFSMFTDTALPWALDHASSPMQLGFHT